MTSDAELLDAMAKLADLVCAQGQDAASAIVRTHPKFFPSGRVEFLVVAFDPAAAGAHAVSTTAVDAELLRRALTAAGEQLERYLAEHARRARLVLVPDPSSR